MGKVWPVVIRDPIHNIIPFENTDCDKLLLRLINTREFQRLRRIKQLGLSELVFPGANHSRFAHSIGVMQTARLILDRITGPLGIKLDGVQRTTVLVAALLHDVGHGPFSHAFESVAKPKHEEWTRRIILDDSTEVNRGLQDSDPALPERVARFFDEDVDSAEGGEVPAFLTHVVSSQLDADRFDYLLRDSRASGTDYGYFDLQWLVHHLCVDEAKKRLYVNRKAQNAAQAYVFARFHMYQAVYFHKATRAAEVMLRLLFKRYRALLEQATTQAEKDAVAPHAPRCLIQAFAGEMSLADYLVLDDHTMTEFLKGCERSKDPILVSLGAGLLHRCLYKVTDATDAERGAVGEFHAAGRDIVGKRGLDPEYAFVTDTPADTPYKVYDPDAEKPATQIYVERLSGQVEELSQFSEPVNQLRKKYTLLRYYYPADVREEMNAVAEQCFGRSRS